MIVNVFGLSPHFKVKIKADYLADSLNIFYNKNTTEMSWFFFVCKTGG